MIQFYSKDSPGLQVVASDIAGILVVGKTISIKCFFLFNLRDNKSHVLVASLGRKEGALVP